MLSSRFHALWLAAVLTAASLAPHSACAQHEPTPGEIALARQEFRGGVESARAGAWNEALGHFERSYSLYPHPETLFNLAGAQRRLGRVVAATESYRAYLRLTEDGAQHDNRARARAALAELEPQLSFVTLHIDGVLDGDRVELDGVPVHRAVLRAALPVDPGEHQLAVFRDHEEVLRQRFQIKSGERLKVTHSVPARGPGVVAPTSAPSTPPPSPSEVARRAVTFERTEPEAPAERSRRVRRAAIWTSVALALAGGITAAVLLTRRDQPDEVEGSLGPNVLIR